MGSEKAVSALLSVYRFHEYRVHQTLCETPVETVEGRGLIAPFTISSSIRPQTQTKPNPASVLLSAGGINETKNKEAATAAG